VPDAKSPVAPTTRPLLRSGLRVASAFGVSACALVAREIARAVHVSKVVSRTLVVLPQLALVLFFAGNAHARNVDRVVAVAGEHVILSSEVRAAAAPWLRNLAEKDPLARARGETKILRDTCERMIDDALVRDEAERLHLSVAEGEVDHAVASVAESNKVSVEQLMKVATDQGYDAETYRASLRAQLIVMKVLYLRHVDVKKIEDAESALHAELRAKVYVEDRLTP